MQYGLYHLASSSMADAFLPDRLRQAGQRLRGMATQAAQHVTGQLRNGAPSAPTSPLLDKINASSHEQRLEELKEASWAQDVDDEVAVFYRCGAIDVREDEELAVGRGVAERWANNPRGR